MWVVPMFLAAGSRFSIRTGTSAESGISNGQHGTSMYVWPPVLGCRSMR
jgi:hypothetical protein